MKKMFSKDEKQSEHKRDPSNDGGEVKIQARENSAPKRIKIYKKKDFEMNSSAARFDAKYEISGPAAGNDDQTSEVERIDSPDVNLTNQKKNDMMDEEKDDGNMMNDLEALDDMDRADTRSNDDSFADKSQRENLNAFENIQEKLFETIEGEEVEDVIDINEKFLVQ